MSLVQTGALFNFIAEDNMQKGPYHNGEIAVQEITDERDMAMMNGRVIEDHIPAGAIPFIAQQYYCVLGRMNKVGEIWSSFVTGDPGFASVSEDKKTVSLNFKSQDSLYNQSPVFDSLQTEDLIGCLFIELATRRRLRVNGVVKLWTDNILLINVHQAYPNCPKYIQRRTLQEQNSARPRIEHTSGNSFTDDIRKWISQADTFFVSSAHPDGSCDASHRGGEKGFIQLLSDDALRIPDYPGNSMFNTFGNFQLNPKAGLVFVDFDQNRQLQLTGNVKLDFNAEEVKSKTGGTGRWWEFKSKRWIISPLNKTFAWQLIDMSPFNP